MYDNLNTFGNDFKAGKVGVNCISIAQAKGFLRAAHPCAPYMEYNICYFEIYDTTYEEVHTALEQIEKETEENFDKTHPKPYPPHIKEETEKYRNEVVYHSEIRNLGKEDGFYRFYIVNEQPELIHELLRHLGKNLGKAKLIANDKAKRPYATIDYGVYVTSPNSLEGSEEEYEQKKALIIKENKRNKEV